MSYKELPEANSKFKIASKNSKKRPKQHNQQQGIHNDPPKEQEQQQGSSKVKIKIKSNSKRTLKKVSSNPQEEDTISTTNFSIAGASDVYSNRDNVSSRRVKHSGLYSRSISSSVYIPHEHTKIVHAIKNNKIFVMHKVCPGIKRALIRRGWIQKIGRSRKYSSGHTAAGPDVSMNFDQLRIPYCDDDFSLWNAWTRSLLKNCKPDLIWTCNRDLIHWNVLLDSQLVNSHPNALFTTKVGIADCIHNFHWHSEQGVSNTYFPRCYRLRLEEERGVFIADFRLTACIGLLKWLVGAFERDGARGIFEPPARPSGGGTTITTAATPPTPSCVDFAAHQIINYVRIRRHEDLDWSPTPGVTLGEWTNFLNQYYSVVLFKLKITAKTATDEPGQNHGQELYEKAKRALQRLAPYWSQLNSDGTNNIWICKPGSKCRGIGIVLLNNLDKVLNSLSEAQNMGIMDWVIQKYIERPLLIYGTKFDIRQWFLVTDWSPLTVWFYKECYIRFCSTPFTLEDFHESIHLSNYAVQKRYKNSSDRDAALPEDNMWDHYTFQAYLKTLGKMNLWSSEIVPGMKQGILGVILASQEGAIARKNSFELYGADFLLCEDYHPWLMEINSGPDMSPTTTVTKRMCSQCFEDLARVIIDRRARPTAHTGLFELIYKQNMGGRPPKMSGTGEIVIAGKKLSTKADEWKRVYSMSSMKTGNKNKTFNFKPLQTMKDPGLTFMNLSQIQSLQFNEESKRGTRNQSRTSTCSYLSPSSTSGSIN